MKMTKQLILHNLIKIAEKVGLDLDGDLVTFINAANGIPVTYFIDVRYFVDGKAPISNPLDDESHIDSWEAAEKLIKDIYNDKYRAIMSANLNHVGIMHPRTSDVDYDVRGCDISAITGRLRDVKS